MAQITPEKARSFVAALPLPAVRPTRGAAAPEVPISFDQLKDQAMVVASDVIAFTKGVTEQRRADMVNASLLAQLAAKEQTKNRDPDDVKAWFEAYKTVLSHLGLAIQESSYNEFHETGQSVETHEAVLAVASTLLGAAPAALEVIKVTLNALKGDGPWITLFERESKAAKAAKFQITLAQQGENDEFLVTLMAFSLRAQATLTQVLFVKVSESDVKLIHAAHKVTISPSLLDATRALVQEKLVGRATGFIKELKI